MGSEQRHAGKHFVVTGAGTGIGRAIALRLAADGARLSLVARDVARLDETRAQAGSSQIHVAGCDIRDAAAVDACFAQAAREHGPFNAVIANSGIGGPNGPSADGDRFDDLIATNVGGTYACLRAAERRLVQTGEPAHMVVISSILARIGVPGYTGYCTSKAALLGLVRAMAAELAAREVQVNAICPGWVDTAMAHEGLAGMADALGVSKEEAHAIAMQAVPLGRMSQPQDVAGMVSWLVSADARGVTGQALDMNGGAFMN